MNLLYILLLGVFDKLRGSGHVPKGNAQIVYGLITVAFLLYPNSNYRGNASFIFSFTLLFVAGVSMGWGQPLGAYIGSREPDPAKKESWQFGSLPKNAFASVLVRGLIWALSVSPCLYFEKRLTLIFMASIAIAFPLAATIAREIVRKGYAIGWELHEFIRGVLLGVMIFIFKLLT